MHEERMRVNEWQDEADEDLGRLPLMGVAIIWATIVFFVLLFLAFK